MHAASVTLWYFSTGALAYGCAYLLHKRKQPEPSAREEGLFAEQLPQNATLREYVEFSLVRFVAVMICLLIWPFVTAILLWHAWRASSASATFQEAAITNCRPEHLVAKTTLAIAEINATTGLSAGFLGPQPFGHLFPEWVTFCAEVDFESEIWRFRIPKGTRYGAEMKLAESDIVGYAIVHDKKIIGEFVLEMC